MNNSNFFKFKNDKTIDILKGWNKSSVIKLKIYKNEKKDFEDFLTRPSPLVIRKSCRMLITM